VAVTTELVLVRHGEANCNVTGIVGGERGCTGLSTRGRRQVTQLADRLVTERPFDAFYGTPRRRVRDTVAILRTALGMDAATVDDLRGPDRGDADGRLWHQVKTAFGGPPQHNPDQPIAPGAETWNQYLARSTAALHEIIDRHPEQRILIAAHGETVESAHVLLFQLPPVVRRGIGFVTEHAAITRWQQHVNRFDRRVWTLVTHNDTSHLAS
jgi:2,3-bisphosphoglycerate-dependent phosphoglycerate mutase